jgi:hypothetical protein
MVRTDVLTRRFNLLDDGIMQFVEGSREQLQIAEELLLVLLRSSHVFRIRRC